MRLVLRLALPIIIGFGVPAALAQEAPLQLDRPSASGSFLAGQQAARDLRPGDAASFFLDASEADWENPQIIQQAFTALVASGKIADAEAVAQRLLSVEPQNEMARLLLATVALKERRYASTLKQLENVGMDSFVGITATIVKAWALIGDGRTGEAEALMAELASNGLDEFLVFHRALMADVASQTENALSFIERAHENDPLVARIIEARVRMLANAARFGEAQQVLDDYAREGLAHPIVTRIADSVQKGVRPGKLAGSPQEGASEMYHGIGAALARDGTPDVAIYFLRMGLYLRPESDIVAMALAQMFERAGHFDSANEIYEGIPNGSPMKSLAQVHTAENIDAMGNREEAIRRLNNLVTSDPQNEDAIGVLGDLYRYDEKYEEAITAYTKALDLRETDLPLDWKYYYLRGISNERAGHWENAEADFLRALELNPGQPQVLNYLGYSWVDQGMHLKRALDMIREAVSASPGDGYIIDSLGWAFYKLADYEQAVEILEQAVKLRPNDPEINDHLGDAYWRAGRKLEAQFQWKIAVSVDEDGNVSERASGKLASGLDGQPAVAD